MAKKRIITKKSEVFLERYINNPSPTGFESEGQKFMGIIKGVSQSGKLHIQLEDDSIITFDNQEVKFLF